MAHYLVVGRTESGKSSWAKVAIEHARAHGFRVMVLDALRDPSYKADFITSDPEDFRRRVFHRDSEKCLLVVDEAGFSIGRYAPEMETLATMSRHKGHQCVFVTQMPIQISPTIRNNCANLVCFAIGPQAARVLSESYGRREILEAVDFERGKYLFVPSFGPLVRGDVFADMKKVGIFRG